MAKSEETIKSDIKAYIEKGRGAYADWYVGISKDPRGRLFNGHGVHEKGDLWIYSQAETAAAAQSVESYFVNTLGTDGGTGGGDKESEYVYAYKKNAHTDP
jgi:hypothetical protein